MLMSDTVVSVLVDEIWLIFLVEQLAMVECCGFLLGYFKDFASGPRDCWWEVNT